MSKYSDIIRSLVTVPQAVQFYMPSVNIVRGRIPCPLHNGSDRNMSLQDRFFHCFVCNESGDVIKLVMHLFDCSYQDAIKRINDDFRLGLPLDGGSLYKTHMLDKKYREFMRKREQEKAEESQKEAEYHAALDIWCLYDKWRRDYAPIAVFEEFDPRYVMAIKNIDAASERVNDALHNLIKKR